MDTLSVRSSSKKCRKLKPRDYNVSLTPFLLVIAVSDPDDVIKDMFTEDV